MVVLPKCDSRWQKYRLLTFLATAIVLPLPPENIIRYREEKDFDIHIISKPNYDLLKSNYDL